LLSSPNQRWLDDFVTKHNRPPRVLHIGNIANNAYNNAKILRQAGLHSDVICYDYYHMMGCPEWEDADFEDGAYGNDFKPNWQKANIKNFKRPNWFVQGRLDDCQNFLIAKSENNKLQMAQDWENLSRDNGTFGYSCYTNYDTTNRKRKLIKSLQLRLSWLKRTLYYYYLGLERNVTASSNSDRMIDRASGSLMKLGLYGIWLIYKFYSASKSILRRYVIDNLASNYKTRYERLAQERFFNSRAHEFARQFRDEFPDRSNQLAPSEINVYRYTIPKWRKVLNHYDIVIAYSTLTVIPYICKKEYFGFEHGTLRDIPYVDDSQGKLTTLSYRFAKHAFVTNFDCVESAQYLTQNRFTTINHPYDEDHGKNISGHQQLRNSLKEELASEFLFFHPTRQDWVEGKGYADKNNDVFIKAFISLKKAGHKVGLVCCNWGHNVKQTQALLDRSGCSPYVKWISPLAITPFERMCLASDVVVDQFKLGAFGGVLFKALSVGAPVLTYLDEEAVLEQYAECPPVINCKTGQQLVERLEPLIYQHDALLEIGKNGRAWIEKYHSKIGTVNKQVDQFREHYKS